VANRGGVSVSASVRSCVGISALRGICRWYADTEVRTRAARSRGVYFVRPRVGCR
jgi:hypothetical protein